MKKNIYVSIICFFLLVMMFSGVMIYRHFKEAHTQEEIYDSLVEIVMYLKNKAKYQRNKRSGVDN